MQPTADLDLDQLTEASPARCGLRKRIMAALAALVILAL
jgi:hypothetical protein